MIVKKSDTSCIDTIGYNRIIGDPKIDGKVVKWQTSWTPNELCKLYLIDQVASGKRITIYLFLSLDIVLKSPA